MTIKRLISLMATAVLLVCLAACAAAEPLTFDMAAYISGISELDLSPYSGKVIVLHFFASSEEGAAQLPAMKLLYDDFAKEEVEIVLIHAWDGEGQAESEALQQSLGLEGMTIYEDENCALSGQLGVTAYPNTLFLDEGGNPVSGYGGRLNYTTAADVLLGLNVTQLQNSYLPAE